MAFNFPKVLAVAARVLGAVLSGVPAVETFAATIGHLTGEQKKTAVVALVQNELTAAETLLGHPLAQDADILAAAGDVTDAVVRFHNLLASKITAAPAA